jgi:poly(beta-D-mannuronate) lyase
MLLRTLALSVYVLLAYAGFSQTAIQTSFETAQGYTAGNLHNQQGWSLTTGSAVVTTAKFHSGTQAVQMNSSNTAYLLNYVAYSGSVPGITGEVYADCWINPVSFATKGIAINGYDLYGGSSKRIFVIEFGIDNTIKVYNGSSAVNVGTWTGNQWVRLSVKMDFATEKYKVAINGAVLAADYSFRETYTPTASGTRQAGVKEFHSLRFNHTNDTQAGTTDAAMDDLYVGTAAIADISFGGSSNVRTITVTQPTYGSIALNPGSPYQLGQSVTATLTLPQGYMNNGWTGDLSGPELVKTFTVNNNMTIGATTGVDLNNPPPKYKITINAPANGSITLSPYTTDSMYYKETKVTATISYEACYQFTGWTGDLSGVAASNNFTVQNAMTIGAAITPVNTPPVKRNVSTVTEFKNALNAMNPGDTIAVANGTYNMSSFTISRSGCSERPILIIPQNDGQVILNGATALVFRNVKYITFKGFHIQSSNIGTGIKMENCSKMRITGNRFAITETTSCTWVYIGDTFGSPEPLKSGYNRVDHNTFDGKTQAGNYIRMDGNIDQQSRYDTIDHNWFKNNGPRADNEKESIRIGVSTLSKSSGFTIVEYNLFEDCDGDPEIVSVKSCDNIIRYNTFRRCLGTLCLRQGSRSVAEGNYFFGEGKTATFNGGTIGCGGVRVYGKDHTIINNYFHGLTGFRWDAAITITNGDVNNNSTSLSSHYLPENLVVAFNTLVNNVSNIEIGFNNGGSYPLAPINCMLANNIVVDSTNPIIKSYNAVSLEGVNFSNNIMYPTQTSSIGITTNASQVTVVDPKLAQPACNSPLDCGQMMAYKVFRLSAGSPAIDAATGNYPLVTMDNERQLRSGVKDIGADEYSNTSPVQVNFGALDATHVGPDGIDYMYSYSPSVTLPARLLNFTASKNGKVALLQWQVSEEINVERYDVEWSSNGNGFTSVGNVTATAGNAFVFTYSFTHANPATGSNYYRVKIIDRDGRVAYTPVRKLSFTEIISLSLYPNPARQSVTVGLNVADASAVTVKLISMTGAIVKTITTNNQGNINIPLSGIAAGIYQVQAWQQGELIATKGLMLQ